MTRVGWLQDPTHYLGGAELTAREFRDAAPEGVEIVYCPPGHVDADLDRYIAHNVVHYEAADLHPLRTQPITWFHHDLSPWIKPEVKSWLNYRARHIFCSPEQRDRYGLGGECIPPPLDLDRFKAPRQSRKRRKGTCSLAQWRNYGKGPFLLAEWAAKNGPVDVYGGGDRYLPEGPNLTYKGALEPDKVAQTLWSYEAFAFFPLEFEPFCRTIAEAHAAGCRVITNKRVGATWWLENKPEALRTASSDFWDCVLA